MVKRSVCLVKIGEAFAQRVFCSKAVAAKWAMSHAGEQDWEVVLFTDGETVAKGSKAEQGRRFRCKMIF